MCIVGFLGLQVSADYTKGIIDRETITEENGFKWKLSGTRYGSTGLITEGAEVDGKTVIPLYSGVAYIKFMPLKDKGIFRAHKVDLPGGYKEYLFYNIDGEIIYQTDDLFIHPAYDESKGLFFRDNHDFTDYISQRRDEWGRVVKETGISTPSNNLSKNNTSIIGNSSNNDKYWFQSYTFGKLNSLGKPEENTFKVIKPTINEGEFEVLFSYTDDPRIPLNIYLNEVNSKGEPIKTEYLGSLLGSRKTSIEYKPDGVNIFLVDKHIHVHNDGMIIIYSIPGGTYANGDVRLFNPGVMEPVYKVRYEVLKDKLRNLVKQ